MQQYAAQSNDFPSDADAQKSMAERSKAIVEQQAKQIAEMLEKAQNPDPVSKAYSEFQLQQNRLR